MKWKTSACSLTCNAYLMIHVNCRSGCNHLKHVAVSFDEKVDAPNRRPNGNASGRVFICHFPSSRYAVWKDINPTAYLNPPENPEDGLEDPWCSIPCQEGRSNASQQVEENGQHHRHLVYPDPGQHRQTHRGGQSSVAFILDTRSSFKIHQRHRTDLKLSRRVTFTLFLGISVRDYFIDLYVLFNPDKTEERLCFP